MDSVNDEKAQADASPALAEAKAAAIKQRVHRAKQYSRMRMESFWILLAVLFFLFLAPSVSSYLRLPADSKSAHVADLYPLVICLVLTWFAYYKAVRADGSAPSSKFGYIWRLEFFVGVCLLAWFIYRFLVP